MLLRDGETTTFLSSRKKHYTIKNEGGKLVCYAGDKVVPATREIERAFSTSTGGAHHDVFVEAVYTDEKPGGEGGYGALVRHDDVRAEYLGGTMDKTTYSRLCLQGVIEALTHVPEGDTADVYTRSKHVAYTMCGKFRRTANKDLWDAYDAAAQMRIVKGHWIAEEEEEKYRRELVRCRQLARGAEPDPEACGSPAPDPHGEKAQKKSIYDIQKVLEASVQQIPRRPQDDERHSVDSRLTAEQLMQEIKAVMTKAIYVPYDREKRFDDIQVLMDTNHVTKRCAETMIRFWQSDKGFDDYEQLRIGLEDIYTKMPRKELEEATETPGALAAVREYLDNYGATSALRWHARGLLLEDAIRKVLIDRIVHRY